MDNNLFDFGIDKKMIMIGGFVGLFVAGCLAAPEFFPQAFASEPQSHLLDRGKDLFPAPFDMKRLKKFDITLDDGVSTQITHTEIIKKIGFGQKKIVSVITTPSGTYSSDALTSPYVKYPGITVEPKWEANGHGWAFGHIDTPFGSGEWSSITSGSFTYWNYAFKPKVDART